VDADGGGEEGVFLEAVAPCPVEEVVEARFRRARGVCGMCGESAGKEQERQGECETRQFHGGNASIVVDL
jgi:hypothetical protein